MTIRDYRPDDTEVLIKLFRGTVRQVNLGDYSSDQVAAWAPDDIDAADWAERQARNRTLVAELDDEIAGFAELQDGTYVHMLYVHKDYQGRGVASALLTRIENMARRNGAERLTSDVSITARPFFACRGFAVVSPQTVTLRGQEFSNFRMAKDL